MTPRYTPRGVPVKHPWGYARHMQLPEETTQSAIRRLKRAQGQLGGIIRMLEFG